MFRSFLLVVTVASTVLSQQTPVFRTGTNIVRIDAIVVDADGRAVTGLRAEDFELHDDGARRELAVFDEIAHEPPPPSSWPARLRLDVAANGNAGSDRVIVLVLDDLHFQAKTDLVKTIAARVVDEVGPRATLALVTTSGTFGVEPTDDHALLLAEIDRFVDRFDPEGKRTKAAVPDPPRIPKSNDPGDLARFFGDMTQYKVLEDIAKEIGASDDRRKAFVWISGGGSAKGTVESSVAVPQDPFYPLALNRMLASLHRSNVTTYGVHTGDQEPRLLRYVAAQTGGFVIRAGDFDRQIGSLIADLDHYYMLGFRTDDREQGKYHEHALELRVNRPGLTLRYRRSYSTGAPPPSRNKTLLPQLAENTVPRASMPLKLHAAAVAAGARKTTNVAIAMEVEADRAHLLPTGDVLNDTLEYTVWAVELKRKRPVASVSRKVAVEIKASEEVDRVTYQVQASLALTPGNYQLRAAATSEGLNDGGSVYLQTTVPDLSGAVLAFGGPVLSMGGDGRAPIVGARTASDLLRVDPTLSREFASSGRVRLTCDLARPPGIGDVAIAIELLDAAGGVVREVQKRTIALRESAFVDVMLPIAGLAPGGYRVHLTAVAAKSLAETDVGFVVLQQDR